jgi:hypothetical protein
MTRSIFDFIEQTLPALAESQHTPEVVSVAVVVPAGVTISDEQVRDVAPQIAKALYPTRFFGATVNVEQIDATTYHADVLVVGTPYSAVNFKSTQNGR